MNTKLLDNLIEAWRLRRQAWIAALDEMLPDGSGFARTDEDRNCLLHNIAASKQMIEEAASASIHMSNQPQPCNCGADVKEATLTVRW
jgi:hypothetical protein